MLGPMLVAQLLVGQCWLDSAGWTVRTGFPDGKKQHDDHTHRMA
jgi:hypothetical protein